jgi:hypothetical protein
MSVTGPAPGWYPDPVGSGTRWWDGRSWSDFRQPAQVEVVPQPPLPQGASTGTPWIYLQALIPVAQIAAQLPYLLSFRTLFAAQFALMSRSRGSVLPPAATRTLLTQYAGVFGVAGVTFGLSFLLLAAWVVLAVLDVRRLERIGVVQPFHWAWSLLGLVYPIGRAVVVSRRVGRGLGPLWVLIGAAVGSMVIALGVEAAIFVPIFTDVVSSSRAATGTCGC